MVLNVDSDATYLVLPPRARSRLVRHFFLSSTPSPTRTVLPNRLILTECKTICHVVSSTAAEAETAALFHNAQMACPICHILTALIHPQPLTHLKTDNATANTFIHQTMQHKIKILGCEILVVQRKFCPIGIPHLWDKGVNNWADYFTRHFSPSGHQVLRQCFVHWTNLVLDAICHTLCATMHAMVC